MKNRERGYAEGASHIFWPSPAEPEEGSITKAKAKENLYNYVIGLKYKIDFNSPEGETVQYLIQKDHQITNKEIQKAEQEERDFDNEKSVLEIQIQSFNNSLKTKCFFASMLIITAPFCYLYYKSHKRDATQETQKLREFKIDESLKSKVDNYKKELEDYKQESEQSKHHDKDIKDHQYKTAKQAYEEGKYVNFKYAIINSINWHNDKAVLFLLEKYKENRIGDIKEEMYEKVRINLLLFSSFLGNKQSAKELADIFFDHPKIKQRFLKKSRP